MYHAAGETLRLEAQGTWTNSRAIRRRRRHASRIPATCSLIVAKGDEVLDWREMVGRYPDVHKRVIDGSDHGLSDFDAYVDDVIDFATAP